MESNIDDLICILTKIKEEKGHNLIRFSFDKIFSKKYVDSKWELVE